MSEPTTLTIARDMVAPDGTYTGPDASNWQGDIVIKAGLGTVRFKGWLRASLSICAEAGWGIEAGSGIEAGEGIKAGEGIEAGWGIKAGFAISAKSIRVSLRIFAGLCMWRLPSQDETEVRAELLGGTIAHGTHVPPQAEG